ncbi:keratin, type I cytoskeletal 9 [Teleopsis dalmanni]|uniref:keratin, type I cytoskeletal 9 n=1 Tax=Teleopsis dalmanni TaxID=139649 RepID=UPI0018CFBC73|nr:keratin, type I cytoskeletal 9 [Teleopsis dalmanni]
MNKFVVVILACVLLSSANARPDLSHGYRYNAGHSSGGGGFLQAPTSISSSSSYSPVASGTSYFNAAPAIGQSGFGGSSSGGSSGLSLGGFGGSSSGGSSGGSFGGYNGGSSGGQEAFLGHIQNNQPPIVTKHFYVHSAPEDHDEQQIVRYVNVGRPQQNYRVVFINAPSSSAAKAKIIANVAPVEDKTAIYVLSKKSNELDVSAEVVTPAPVNNKPDVFFIKYKTPQEAVHAQHTIQAQYDALGGSSDLVDAGTVPVSSVIGSLGDSGNGGSAGGNGGGSLGGGSFGGNGGGSTISIGSLGGTGGSLGGSFGGSTDFDTQPSQNFGAINIPHTGDNTQQTYLPAQHK